MSLILTVSILIRLIAFGWSIILLMKVRDWRMGFLAIMLALMATRQMLTFWENYDSWNVFTVGPLTELPGLLVSIMAFLTVIFLYSMLTERNRVEEELTVSKNNYEQIVENANDIIYRTDLAGNFTYINPLANRLMGYTEEEVLGKHFTEGVAPTYRKKMMFFYLNQKRNRLQNTYYEYPALTKDGTEKWFGQNVQLIFENDKAVGFQAVARDITERKKAEFDLANRTYQLVQNQKVLWELAKEEFTNQTASFNQIAKADAEQLNVERVSIWLFNETHTEISCKAIYQGGELRNETKVLRADQYPRYFQALAENNFITSTDVQHDARTKEFCDDYLIPLGITSMIDVPIRFKGEIVGIVCHEHIGPKRIWSVEDEDFAKSISDMCALVLAASESKHTAQKLSYQASHDSLTGLDNRYEFERRAERLLSSVQQQEGEHALCYMDLDQFKVINDTCGHTAGDEMLRQLTSVLQVTARKRDTLARLGGDEFGVLMEHCSLDDAHRVATSLQNAIQNFQFSWEGRYFRIGVSIGLVAITKTTTNLTELLKEADTACYMAKDKGRNRIHVYRNEDSEIAQRHGEMQWVSRLNQALDDDQLFLYSQAIVPLHGDIEEHYELLLRMIDDKGEIIQPGAFLPAAERYNLISKLDCWVIKQAFSLLADNPVFLKQVSFCSINLSGQSLATPEILDFIISQLNVSGISEKKICFEITETAAISNLSSAMTFISTLKTLGCRFALDDFGSGLSSFGYLKNLPVDFLKIDGMFVKDIVDDPIDHAMVKSINEIGHVMGMQTIAEFVENDEIKGMLREIGVNYAQGYGIGKPVAFDSLLNQANNISTSTTPI